MKITELLRLLEKDNGNTNYLFRIFGDGSGNIEDSSKEQIVEFDNEEEMQKVLNKLFVEILETSQIKFEL